MSISFHCGECDCSIRVKDEAAGKSVRCPKCQAKLKVPPPDDDILEDDVLEELPVPVRRRPPEPPPKKKVVKKKRKERGEGSALWAQIGAGLFGLMVILGLVARVAVRAGLLPDRRAQARATPLHSPVMPPGMPAGAAAPGGPVGAGETLPSAVAQIPLPQFPDLGPGRPVGSQGVLMQTLSFSPPPTSPGAPGGRMKVRIYLPAGEADPQSLPCVLVAPAGTPLLFGHQLEGEDYHDETLPYAEAGMVAVLYELDGGVANAQHATDAQFQTGYLAFRAAAAGVVNSRNALDFVLAKLPQVNPQRIFTAGHSSAGTEALLFAAHEPRLKGCIAYAPCSDVEARLRQQAGDAALVRLLPGLREFVRWSSPLTYVDRLKCPVFLFHALDDSNIPYAETLSFSARLQPHNTQVTLNSAARGDHYQPMISEGIPAAIRWIQGLQ